MSDCCSKFSRSDRLLLLFVPITVMPIASAVLASLVPASICVSTGQTVCVTIYVFLSSMTAEPDLQ